MSWVVSGIWYSDLVPIGTPSWKWAGTVCDHVNLARMYTSQCEYRSLKWPFSLCRVDTTHPFLNEAMMYPNPPKEKQLLTKLLKLSEDSPEYRWKSISFSFVSTPCCYSRQSRDSQMFNFRFIYSKSTIMSNVPCFVSMVVMADRRLGFSRFVEIHFDKI